MPNDVLQRYSRRFYFSEEDRGYIALCAPASRIRLKGVAR